MFDADDKAFTDKIAQACISVRDYLPNGWDAMRAGQYEHVERRAYERVRRDWFDAMDAHLVCSTLTNAAKAIEDILSRDASSSPVREGMFFRAKLAREVVHELGKRIVL